MRSIGYYGFFRFAFSLSDRVSNNVRHTVALKLVEFDFWSARTRHCGDADLRSVSSHEMQSLVAFPVS